MSKVIINEKFPDLEVDLLYAGKKNISELFDAEKTVIWCLRYIGCTVCNLDIRLAAMAYDEVKAKNAKIVFALQSTKENILNELKELVLPFDIICDPEMKFYQALEIEPAASMEECVGGPEDLAKLQAKGAKCAEMGLSHGVYEGNEQQLPAMFMVDSEGKAVYVNYAKNIVALPTIDEVIEML